MLKLPFRAGISSISVINSLVGKHFKQKVWKKEIKDGKKQWLAVVW